VLCTPPGKTVIHWNRRKEQAILRLALVFFIISILAAVFGLTGIAGASASIAQILFFAFLALCVVVLIAGLVARRAIR
jgi:uncharacterized membrane protein YtjA (UPF0391 family)